MKIEVENFRGIDRAEIADEMISLLVGRNGAGKTSVLLATACALSGDLTPLGLRKTDGGALVKSGASTAVATVTTATGTARAEWPKAERSTTDQPPFASDVAVGLKSPIDMTEKDRAVYFGELLETDPTREDFDKACIEAGIVTAENVSKLDKIWATVERDGWAAAHTRAIDSGKTQKGQWEQVTKEKWGIKKGEEWQPEGWDTDLQSASLDGLEDAVTAARADVEFHVGRLAVSEEYFERLQERADKLDERKAAMDEAKEDVDNASASIRAIEDEIEGIGPTSDDPGLACPHCGERVQVKRLSAAETTLAKVEKIDAETLKKRRTATASAEGRLGNARQQHAACQTELDRATEDYEASKEARTELDKGISSDGSAQEDVDAARERERKAIRERDAFKAKVEADRIHASIKRNQEMIDILAPSGVRHTVLKRALDEFNGRLVGLCKAARWGAVTINDTLGIEYAGRLYALASASEQFRCRTALQIACADLDGSEAVIIDGAEILDTPARGGLIGMLAKRGKRALIGMTIKSRADAPDLAAKGVGDVYWIECGKVTADEAKAA